MYEILTSRTNNGGRMSLIALEIPPKFTVVPVTIRINFGNGESSVESFREVPGVLILFGVWIGISCELGNGSILHPLVPMKDYRSGLGMWLAADRGVERIHRIIISDRDEDGIDFLITTYEDPPRKISWGSITQRDVRAFDTDAFDTGASRDAD